VINASIFQFEGQVTVLKPFEGPCYRCLYPAPPPPGMAPSCNEAGVLGVLPGVIGVVQARAWGGHLGIEAWRFTIADCHRPVWIRACAKLVCRRGTVGATGPLVDAVVCVRACAHADDDPGDFEEITAPIDLCLGKPAPCG
jgi:hypothetical protein